MPRTRVKKPLTDKQRAHIEELNKRNAERFRKPRDGAVAVADPPVATESAEADILRQLGQALMAEGQTRAEMSEKLDQLDTLLGSLSVKDYPHLANNPAVQKFLDLMGEQVATRHPTDPPGTIYNKGALNEAKKGWQWRDVAQVFPDPTCREKGDDCPNCGGQRTCIEVVSITPNETVPVIWNGLSYPLIADVENWVPRPHYDTYRESMRQRVTARQHAEMAFRRRQFIDGIADPSVVNQSTAKVRGNGDGSTAYRPGAGWFNALEEGAAEVVE